MNQRNANYHTYKSKLDRGLNNLYLIFTLALYRGTFTPFC